MRCTCKYKVTTTINSECITCLTISSKTSKLWRTKFLPCSTASTIGYINLINSSCCYTFRFMNIRVSNCRVLYCCDNIFSKRKRRSITLPLLHYTYSTIIVAVPAVNVPTAVMYKSVADAYTLGVN